MALTTMAIKMERNPKQHKKKERKKLVRDQKKKISEKKKRKLNPMERKKRKRKRKRARRIREARGMVNASMASFSNLMVAVPITKIG